MTARALSLHEWIDDFRASVAAQLDEFHPMAQGICHEYFGGMYEAARVGDHDEVARLVQVTHNKIADELFWNGEIKRSAADPSYCVRYSRD